MFRGIDLYSDTVTRPTKPMREAMATAEVGDEQLGEDPTTQLLQNQVAKLLGKSASIFLPSATMANQIAIQLHCRPGDLLIAAHQCHLYFAEAGGPAALAGVMTASIETASGMFNAEVLSRHLPEHRGPHGLRPSLVAVENTTNMGGGRVWGLRDLASVVEIAKSRGIKTHMDGARLINASVSSGHALNEIVKGFDTITLCLSKGLGCPTGALLAFDQKDYDQVRMLKQRMGGSFRQSGILAAAGNYALAHHVERIQDDHDHAKALAHGLDQISGVILENPEPESNILYFKTLKLETSDFLKRCEQNGLRFSTVGTQRIRAVTHLDISKSDVDKALKIVQDVLK